ncbi:MAG: pyridoxamine 5'-phosphate oxidase family protein [Thermoanaerobaculia bacterium]|nr:pyridoxamine 5'-phosphate oxidase family protein [Thermoanaerobaculia bacterium]
MQSEQIPLEIPRRRDRMRKESWIRTVLDESGFGALATAVGDRPRLNINLFVFDQTRDAIYLHTARRGETRSRIEPGVPAAFAVAHMGRILTAEAAIDFSVEYASVVVTGTARIIQDDEEASRALRLLMRKYAPQLEPGVDYRDVEAADLARTTVYRLDIESWSGKENRAPEEAEAFDYPGARSRGHRAGRGARR